MCLLGIQSAIAKHFRLSPLLDIFREQKEFHGKREQYINIGVYVRMYPVYRPIGKLLANLIRYLLYQKVRFSLVLLHIPRTLPYLFRRKLQVYRNSRFEGNKMK